VNQSAGSSGAGPDRGAAAPPVRSQDAELAQPEDKGQAKGAPQPNGKGDGAPTADPGNRIAELEARIAELEARIAELEDLRLRALADLDNMRKRCAVQVSRAEAETRAAVAREWLPVVDNLDRALAYSTADPGAIIEGIKAVRTQALGVLARLGFPRRDDLGARFDPARHEAVASRPDPGAEDGSVAEVIRPAYGEGDHQLRPAQVVVARSG
jgi:molecular chaperone GrpE